MKVKACVRSGECCKASPCGFGRWNSERTQCASLGGSTPGEYYCSLYEDIVKDPTSSVSPAFGSGCCRGLFNESRQKLINDKYLGKEQIIEVSFD